MTVILPTWIFFHRIEIGIMNSQLGTTYINGYELMVPIKDHESAKDLEVYEI